MSNHLTRAALLGAAIALSSPVLAQEHGTKDEAVALVKKAVAHVQAVGQEKACADFANPTGNFQSKDLYVFLQKMNGDMICHAKNSGLNAKNLAHLKDTDGKTFVAEMMAMAGNGSGWVDYKWVNPVSKKIEPKSAYVEKTGDSFIGAGIYK
jgi:cytochrome c